MSLAVTHDVTWLATWNDAMTSLQLLQIDPCGFGGIWLKAPYGPVREAWLRELAAIGVPVTRLPSNTDRERLLGGVDLSLTLQSGTLHMQQGLLAQAHGGLICIPMAERCADALITPVVQAMDTHTVPQAGHVTDSHDTLGAAFGVIALDESDDDDTQLNPSLQERLGLWLDLHAVAPADVVGHSQVLPVVMGVGLEANALAAVRRAALLVKATEEQVASLCTAALGLGISSLRTPTLALRVARVHAALHGRALLTQDDLAFAARRVLAPRATHCPAGNPRPAHETAPETQADTVPEEEEGEATTQSPPDDTERSETAEQAGAPEPTPPVEDLLVAAALASLPSGVLDKLLTRAAHHQGQVVGRSGHTSKGGQRGRPLPPRQGALAGNERLHVLATLRAAAPKQRLRARPTGGRVAIRAQDFHVHRYQQNSATCLLLALDVSGSAALQRLAEAKGAVELLLQQSYARRDSVCIVAFKGAQAQLVLPMTRSLVRAKRALTGLPGGGGTPLASGLKMAYSQAEQLKRQGVTPLLVMLSDGRANVNLAGLGGRAQALADAEQWCNQWRNAGHQALWIDTSVQPDAQVRHLAHAMGGVYLPMPQAQAQPMAAAMANLRHRSA